MNEKPIQTTDALPEAMLKDLQREIWDDYDAIIHHCNYKRVGNGMVAIIQHNPGLKGLACEFDGPTEKVHVCDTEDLRGKLYLVFKNEKPNFSVYGGEKADRINDDTVEAAYEQIQFADQFEAFSKEMEKIMEQEGGKK